MIDNLKEKMIIDQDIPNILLEDYLSSMPNISVKDYTETMRKKSIVSFKSWSFSKGLLVCSKCLTLKRHEKFPTNHRSILGKSSICRKCSGFKYEVSNKKNKKKSPNKNHSIHNELPIELSNYYNTIKNDKSLIYRLKKGRSKQALEEKNNLILMGGKFCNKCNLLLSIKSFGNDKRSIDGLKGSCKNCLNKIQPYNKEMSNTITNIHYKNKIKNTLPKKYSIIYLVKITHKKSNKHMYKYGITSNSIQHRFSPLNKEEWIVEELDFIIFNDKIIKKVELDFLSLSLVDNSIPTWLNDIKDKPKTLGWTECREKKLTIEKENFIYRNLIEWIQILDCGYTPIL